jgi:two-component system CheB/CheR fusion protein
LEVAFLNKKETSGLHTQNSLMRQTEQQFPIVGIGASAGGLEPIKILLNDLPTNTGLAFVIIQHLAAGQESMLPEILSRFTKMSVLKVEDEMPVKPDHVYVIPPGVTMTFENGLLKLHNRGTSHRPIDEFLISLALTRKMDAIGIILSGTGNDGTNGLEAIKNDGGITFVQDPESAQYPDMPLNAISANCVHFVLTPEGIAKELLRISKHPQIFRNKKPRRESQKGAALQTIFSLLKKSFGVNFVHYKEASLQRRLKRRMIIDQIEDIKDYVEFLQTHPKGLQALFDDLLIGVTEFFREPNTFSLLEEKVFPELVKNRSPDKPIRVWIPGCSTGEEVYSFAIAINEFLERKEMFTVPFQIFGTDVNEKNILKARKGIYPKSTVECIAKKRLERFFTRLNGNYEIVKSIRDKCIFAKHDLTIDPPFSSLDLVSCRNVLIYLDSMLQEKVISALHYSLKLNSFLVLGRSEGIGKFTSLFEPLNKKGAIYVKKKPPPEVASKLGVFQPHLTNRSCRDLEKIDHASLLEEEFNQLLITQYVPPTFLVDNNWDILVFRGHVSPYLSPESGAASLNLNKIIRKELRSEIRTVVYRARIENKTVKEEIIPFDLEGKPQVVSIQAMPLRIANYDEPFFIVSIENATSAAASVQQEFDSKSTLPERGREKTKDRQIRELEEAVESAKSVMQSVIEAQETTNEELRAAMEEVQSNNEELQSTNEELETAKEELQSSNEELKTLNDELKERNQTLKQLNEDLANLLENVDPAVVMLDSEQKIRFFTPSAQKTLGLNSSHVGIPIDKIHLEITVKNLEKKISNVIAKGGAFNIEVRDKKGQWHQMRARPYLTGEDKTDGAVLSFVYVDDLKKIENTLRIEKEKYRTLTENSPDIIARFDRNLRCLYINSTAKEIIGTSPEKILGKTSEEIGLPKKFAQAWNNDLQKTTRTGKVEIGEVDFSNSGQRRIYQHIAVPEFLGNSTVASVLSILRDITEKKKLAESETLITIGETAGMIGHDIRNPLQAIALATYSTIKDLSSLPSSKKHLRLLKNLKMIQEELEYTDKIVSDLQDFTKPLNPQLEETAMEEIFRDALLNINIPETIQVSHSVEKDFPKLMTDYVYMKRILTNLVLNAVQAMPGGGKLTLKAFREEDHILITVEDTGVGIPEEVKHRLFQPLFTTKSKGQGFGLPVCRRLIVALNGTITFESQASKGTKFTIKLPAAK